VFHAIDVGNATLDAMNLHVLESLEAIAFQTWPYTILKQIPGDLLACVRQSPVPVPVKFTIVSQLFK
jgi:hypothetical protein